MKSTLTKLVNRYTITYLVLFLVCVSAMLLAYLIDEQQFRDNLFFIVAPGIFLAMLLDIYMTGIANTTWYQIVGLVLATFFSSFIWSLPIWGILFVAQINPWKRANKK